MPRRSFQENARWETNTKSNWKAICNGNANPVEQSRLKLKQCWVVHSYFVIWRKDDEEINTEEHPHALRTHIPRVLMSITSIALLTEPAELILALSTSHHLAPSILGNKHPTWRTSHCEENFLQISPEFAFSFGCEFLPTSEARWISPAVVTFLTNECISASFTSYKSSVSAARWRTDNHVIRMSEIFKCVELFDFIEQSWVFYLLSQLFVRDFSSTSIRTTYHGIRDKILTIEDFLNPVRHTVLTAWVATVKLRQVFIVHAADRTLWETLGIRSTKFVHQFI